MPRIGTGLALGLVSAVTFSTSGTFAASLITAGWTPGAAVTVRVVIAAVVLSPFALHQLRGHGAAVVRGLPAVATFGVAAVGVPQLCYFNAVQRVPVAVALLLEYSGILLVVLWMWGRHGNRPGRLTTTGALTALAGLVLVLNLTGVDRLDPVGIAWGLGAAVGLAAYFVLSARTDSALPPLVMAWGGLVVGALVLVVAAVCGVLPVRMPLVDVVLAGHRTSWLVPVLGLSLVAAVIAYVAGIAAARRLGARLASFVGLAEVLTAVVFAWALLGQTPTGLQVVGGSLVVLGVAMVRLAERPTPVASPDPSAPAATPAQ